MLVRLGEEVEPSIPGDPVVDMDDQVAFVQIQEAVDRPGLVSPTGRGPADLGAGEQLVIADDQGPGVDQVESRPDPADGQRQPVGPGQLGVGEDFPQPVDLGRIVAGDQDVVAGGGALQLGLDLGQVAGEPLDALDPQVAGRFQRIRGQGRDGDRGEPDQPLEARVDSIEAPRILDPAEIMATLLAQVVRLQQGDPRPVGEEFGRVPETGWVRVLEPEGGGQGDRVPTVERALGFRVERPDRFDLVAEELDADRVGRIRRKDVEDAATDAELAGDIHDLGSGHAALQQPARQFLDRHRIADSHHPRHLRQRFRARHRLEHRLERRDDQARRIRPPQLLEHAEPAAEDLVGGVQLTRELVPGGEDLRSDPGEGCDVVAKIVHIADMSQHDHQGRGGMEPQGRARQGRRGAPGTVDGRTPAILQRGQEFRKPRRALDQSREIFEPTRFWILDCRFRRLLSHWSPAPRTVPLRFWILDFRFWILMILDFRSPES